VEFFVGGKRSRRKFTGTEMVWGILSRWKVREENSPEQRWYGGFSAGGKRSRIKFTETEIICGFSVGGKRLIRKLTETERIGGIFNRRETLEREKIPVFHPGCKRAGP